MQVNTLIKPSAQIIRIAEVSKGDVYKRMHTPSYGTQGIVYGVVMDVLHNGEEAILTGLEFSPVEYGNDIAPTVRTFKGDTEVSLFPATVEEYRHALTEAIKVQQRSVDIVEKDWQAKHRVLKTMQTQLTSELTPPLLSTVQLEVES